MGSTARRGAKRRGRVGPRAVRPPRKASPSRARRRATETRARAVFGVVMVALVAAAGVSLVRVAVTVRATEMTIGATRLQERIKEQRIETDRLEIDRSSLATPSRIENIACSTMRMTRPASVRYLRFEEVQAQAAALRAARADGDADDPAEGLAAMVETVMDLSAGEAQALLVGDVGLAGAR